MPTKLLVTGSTGQLGREFCSFESSEFEIIGISRKDADITKIAEVRSAINKFKPDIVIHTAAMVDVDDCELNPELAMNVNSIGARNVALAANESSASVVYISTDYVFDGNKGSAYVESDTTNAISNYGKSKLAGENAIEESNKNWTIIRTSWVYSQYRRNFVKSILKQALSGKTLKVVDDQFSSPTWTKDIVRQTMKIIELKQARLFHVAAKGETSRYDFAKQILTKMKIDAQIEPVSTAQIPRPAKRPMRSTLTSERLPELGIDTMRPYNEALDEFLNQFGDEILSELKN